MSAESALRLEPSDKTSVGLPIYAVVEGTTEPPAIVWSLPDGGSARLAWSREGNSWKAELVGYQPGTYRLSYGRTERLIQIGEEVGVGFMLQVGSTAFAVLLAFAWGARYLRKLEGRV
jgi:hypothetical protein